MTTGSGAGKLATVANTAFVFSCYWNTGDKKKKKHPLPFQGDTQKSTVLMIERMLSFILKQLPPPLNYITK